MRRGRYIHEQLDNARTHIARIENGINDSTISGGPELLEITRALHSLEEAVRALYMEARDHDHPQPQAFGGNFR
jgi:hypothetical protein